MINELIFMIHSVILILIEKYLVHRYRRGFQCDKCKKNFNFLADFVEHTKVHVHRPFTCEMCDVSFIR